MQQQDPLSAYNFYVFINNQALGFQKVSNIEEVVETETIAEGGCDYVHVLPAPPKQINRMNFSKGAGTFASDTFPFKLGEFINMPIHIFVLGDFVEDGRLVRRPRKHYCVLGAIVTKWSLSDFDAENAANLIENFEIQYSKLEQVPIQNPSGVTAYNSR